MGWSWRLVRLVSISLILFLGSYGGVLAQTPVPTTPGEAASDYYNQGDAHYDRNEYQLAIEDYTLALEFDPTYVAAYNNRGNAYYGLAEYDLALADYNRALELDPTYDIAYNNRGNVYQAWGEYDLALADYTYSLELHPDDPLVYSNRGGTYLLMGEDELAQADYNRALELESSDEYIYFRRGNVYIDLGDYASAIADFTSALELNPVYASAYLNRGFTYFHAGDFDSALVDYYQWVMFNEEEPIALPLELDKPSVVALAEGRVYHIPFTAVTGMILTVTVTGLDDVVDPLAVVLGEDGNPLVFDDDSGGGLGGSDVAIAGFAIPANGDYQLLVTHAGGGSYGEVSVVLSLGKGTEIEIP